MADQNKPTETWKVQPMNGLDPNFVLGFNQQIFGVWARSISALAMEMSQFLQTRLQEDYANWQKLIASKDLTEAFECQSRFFQKAMADYADEASKLTRLTMDSALESGSPLRAEAREKAKAAA